MTSIIWTINGIPPEGGPESVELLGFSIAGVVERVQRVVSGRIVVNVHQSGYNAPALWVSRPYATYPAAVLTVGTLLRTREEALRYNEDPNDWLFELLCGLVRQADNSFVQGGSSILRTRRPELEPIITIHCE